MPTRLRFALGAAAGAGNTPHAMPTTIQTDELLPGREEFVAPQPVRTTILALTPVLALAAVGLTGAASLAVAAAAGSVLLTLAGVRSGYAWSDARRSRVLADRLLRTQPGSTVRSPLTAWRAPQLTSERTRRRLVKRVRGLIDDADLSLRASSPPLDRHATEQSLFLLRRLGSRLDDLSRPVSPYGILVARELADGASNPFSWPSPAEMPDALNEALAALDARR
jgi:hypothetical protein